MSGRARVWDISILILIFTGLVVIFSRTVAELDLWGHLSWGQVILDARQIVRVDPFSYLTAGYPWTNHEWLGDVIFAALWGAFGAPGLLLLKLTTWLLTLGLALFWLIRSGLPLLRAGFLVLLAGMLLNGYAISIRPQIFTILCYTLMLLVLLQAEAGRRLWLWALPPLFALWANLHGAWLAALGLLGIWGGVYLLTHRSRQAWTKVIPPLLITPLATLLTPFGIELWRFLLSHLSDRRLEIVEWRPLELHSPFGWVYLIWLILVILGLVFSKKPRSPALLVLLGVSAYLPFVSQRHMLFFALAALLVGGPHIGSAWASWMPVKASQKQRPAWALLLPILAAVLLLAVRFPNLQTIPFSDTNSFPVAATELLRQSQVTGNVANSFNWGNYLSWHLGDQVRVSIDTRREMAYPEEIYQANLRFLTGSGDWSSLLDDYPTDLVLVGPGTQPDNLVGLSPDWDEIYRDAASVLYARRGSAQADRLRETLLSFQIPATPGIFP